VGLRDVRTALLAALQKRSDGALSSAEILVLQLL
jgi:hypothetical protein